MPGSAPDEVGGGMVADVFRDMFVPSTSLASRAEPGTPNIVGALSLACALEILGHVGMEVVAEHEHELTVRLLEGLREIDGHKLYGSTDLPRAPRVGVVTFNLGTLDHGFVTAALHDYFNIALRNGCFCAHPYVRDLLREDIWALDTEDESEVRRRLGMVRASFGLYSTLNDVESLLAAISELVERSSHFQAQYRLVDGIHRHVDFRPEQESSFEPCRAMARALEQVMQP